MRRFKVNNIEMTGKELVDYAYEQYGCQAGKSIKYTSVAAEELKKHGIKVTEKS